MKNELSSRERLLLTIDHVEPDRVPLLFSTFPPPLAPAPSYASLRCVEYLLSMGLDAAVRFDPPMFFPHAPRALGPDVKTRVRKEIVPGEDYPVLFKEYETPRGTLKQVVRQTLDWPHGDDIPLFTDFCVPRPRSIKYLVENENDLDALSCFFPDPPAGELDRFFQEAEDVKRFARERGVLVLCGGFSFVPLFGADALAWLCGIENALMAAFDNPAFLHRLLDIIMEWNTKYIRLLADVGGVDVFAHRAYYESTQFWSPQLYQEFIVPLLRKEIELVHAAGAKFCYIAVDGAMPLLGTLRDVGVDILFGLDPAESDMDFGRVKKEIGDKVCLWGGVSEHITLESLDERLIQKEVRHAVEKLAPGGGFILSAVDNMPALLWQATTSMIEAWRAVCSYPMS